MSHDLKKRYKEISRMYQDEEAWRRD